MILNHRDRLKKLVNKGFIEQDGRQIIDNLEGQIGYIKNILKSMSENHRLVKAWKKIGKDLISERNLIIQVMNDPSMTLAAGKLSWETCVELKRNGYYLSPAILNRFSRFDDSLVVPDSEFHFGKGNYHSVSKLDFNVDNNKESRIFARFPS